jgi:adenine-specific DNA-methyltransferase
MPAGCYTVVKRFSSKEERRRIVANAVDPGKLPATDYGFENHLNVFHESKHGLSKEVAYGLAVYLNCTAVDEWFRSFSGHTQVNATDLRRMHYPSIEILKELGRWMINNPMPAQAQIDEQIAKHGNTNA